MVRSQCLYFGFLAALIAERLFELALSKRHARRALKRGASEVGSGHFRVMATLHTLFFVCCAAEVALVPRSFPRPWGWFFLGAVLCAQALRYWAITTLGERWNVRIIILPGALPVSSGPYRYMRHPNYLAVILEIAFIPLVHGAWLTALVFSLANGALLSVRIRTEERALGPAYAEMFGGLHRFFPR
jgi:methyltransferase